MSNAILHKYSATAGAVPAAGSLTPRELSINTADGRLFTKTDAGAVQEFARVMPIQRHTSGNGSVNAASGIRYLNIDSAVTLLTIVFPPSPIDGQEFGLVSWYTCSGLTCSAPGTNLAGAVTGLTPTTPASWVFFAATSSWLRTR